MDVCMSKTTLSYKRNLLYRVSESREKSVKIVWFERHKFCQLSLIFNCLKLSELMCYFGFCFGFWSFIFAKLDFFHGQNGTWPWKQNSWPAWGFIQNLSMFLHCKKRNFLFNYYVTFDSVLAFEVSFLQYLIFVLGKMELDNQSLSPKVYQCFPTVKRGMSSSFIC